MIKGNGMVTLSNYEMWKVQFKNELETLLADTFTKHGIDAWVNHVDKWSTIIGLIGTNPKLEHINKLFKQYSLSENSNTEKEPDGVYYSMSFMIKGKDKQDLLNKITLVKMLLS